ncbi:MAG: glycosyltransferase [Streptosporangiaceae bacterium]|nr:glycosyltransferase [Streptosporangiaceae bacterium]
MVVPTYNRRQNLELLLDSLARQTIQDFHVIITDDGSTDGTREFVELRARDHPWQNRLQWISCGPHQGTRIGRARNIGTANLSAGTRLLLMLDSDLVLRPEALALYADAHVRHSRHVLFGRVDWLPPMDRSAVAAAIAEGTLHRLRRLVPPKSERVAGTFTGPELRTNLFVRHVHEPTAMDPGWALSLNVGWPLDLYWAIGGFDETFRYGYSDMEMGARASEAGARCLACPGLWALHVWHPKPAEMLVEMQFDLDRYIRRHGGYLRRAGFGHALEAEIDWTLWCHYHAERGGAPARWQGRLWAVSADRRHRLALPGQVWFDRLGYDGPGNGDVAGRDLARAADHGVAAELS